MLLDIWWSNSTSNSSSWRYRKRSRYKCGRKYQVSKRTQPIFIYISLLIANISLPRSNDKFNKQWAYLEKLFIFKLIFVLFLFLLSTHWIYLDMVPINMLVLWVVYLWILIVLLLLLVQKVAFSFIPDGMAQQQSLSKEQDKMMKLSLWMDQIRIESKSANSQQDINVLRMIITSILSFNHPSVLDFSFYSLHLSWVSITCCLVSACFYYFFCVVQV